MLKDADLIGIPYRLVISDKTIAQNSVEIKKRTENNIQLMSTEEVVNTLVNNNRD
jgi:prolyl-tRNA synthetase